ncbi:MAG: lamin tail domain-containing protein [Myxococcota bacterium]|nr:lamin tail domain-containing protein [Myxococcota bacterium]
MPTLLLLTLACAKDDPTDTALDTQDPGSAVVLHINELMASNSSGVQDEGGAYPDWIELYNPGDQDIDLTGYRITDDLDEPDKYILAGVTVPAGGYLLLYADGDTDEGLQHLGFKLSKDGESVGLYTVADELVDSVRFEAQETDISYARVSDGAAEWVTDDTPTPGAANE